MKQHTTTAVILRRINFQEADRIITLLTPDQGKIRVIAKGVRRMKSKLAGGLELLSVSEVTYIQGRSEIQTLISTRLKQHYKNIVKDINRTMLAFEMLKIVDRITEDKTGGEYFDITRHALEGLDDSSLSLELCQAWFTLQIMQISGHSPNFANDEKGSKLDSDKTYNFDVENMMFVVSDTGQFDANAIKLLRLIYGLEKPTLLKQVKDSDKYSDAISRLSQLMMDWHIRR